MMGKTHFLLHDNPHVVLTKMVKVFSQQKKKGFTGFINLCVAYR